MDTERARGLNDSTLAKAMPVATPRKLLAAVVAATLLLAGALRANEGDPNPPTDLTKETLVFAGGDGRILAFWLQTKNLPVSQNVTL